MGLIPGCLPRQGLHIRRGHIARMAMQTRNLPTGTLGPKVTFAMAVPPPWAWYRPETSRPTPSLRVISDESTGVRTFENADRVVGAHDKSRVNAASLKGEGERDRCNRREILSRDMCVGGVAEVSAFESSVSYVLEDGLAGMQQGRGTCSDTGRGTRARYQSSSAKDTQFLRTW